MFRSNIITLHSDDHLPAMTNKIQMRERKAAKEYHRGNVSIPSTNAVQPVAYKIKLIHSGATFLGVGFHEMRRVSTMKLVMTNAALLDRVGHIALSRNSLKVISNSVAARLAPSERCPGRSAALHRSVSCRPRAVSFRC